MDVDRFLARNQSDWRRLEVLVRAAGRHPARLSAEELDELVTLYQRTSTHLSQARTGLRDPALVRYLTTLVARAAAVVYASRPRSWQAVARFFLDTFPAAVWHTRLFLLTATLLFLLPALALATWLATSPAALDVAAPPALRSALVERDFEAYYSSNPAAQFASDVTTNNIRVGITAFAGGIALAVPTALILAFNGVNIGLAAGVFAAAGEHAKFWGLVIPHGLLELTAVFISGAAGLRLGWTLVDPGDRRRGTALVEEGRRAIVLVVGAAAAFVVAGVIEAFVTPFWPTPLRVAVGVVAELAFLALVLLRGRDAAARGLTGMLGEEADERAPGALLTAVQSP